MPVTRIELRRNKGGVQSEDKFSPWFRNMLQQETGEVMESEDGSVEFETPTDDEEVTIPSQDKYRKVPDIPNSDIRDEQTLSNTQREDWLLPTEPMHGARPRQTGRERPPVIDNPALRDAAGNTAVRNPSRTFLLSPGRRISMEEEVFTPPRRGRPTPEPRGVPREVRAIHKPFPNGFQEDRLRDGGQNIGSPVDMLVDMVLRMQKDLAMLREENRVLRTPATSQVIQAPRRAVLTTTKVLRFDGTTSWEQYDQVFEAIVNGCRTAGTMIQQHCNCFRI